MLDDASGKWGIRVTRVEIKAIDPPKSVKDAMEKQMRAEREKRAATLPPRARGSSQILTAEGDKTGKILRAEGDRQAAILRAEGEAQAIATSSARSTATTRTPSCSPTSTCRRYPNWPTARETRSG